MLFGPVTTATTFPPAFRRSCSSSQNQGLTSQYSLVMGWCSQTPWRLESQHPSTSHDLDDLMIELCGYLHEFNYRCLVLVSMNGLMEYFLSFGKVLVFLSPKLYQVCFKQEDIPNEFIHRGPHLGYHCSLLRHCHRLHHRQTVNHVSKGIVNEHVHPDLEARHVSLARPRVCYARRAPLL